MLHGRRQPKGIACARSTLQGSWARVDKVSVANGQIIKAMIRRSVVGSSIAATQKVSHFGITNWLPVASLSVKLGSLLLKTNTTEIHTIAQPQTDFGQNHVGKAAKRDKLGVWKRLLARQNYIVPKAACHMPAPSAQEDHDSLFFHIASSTTCFSGYIGYTEVSYIWIFNSLVLSNDWRHHSTLW